MVSFLSLNRSIALLSWMLALNFSVFCSAQSLDQTNEFIEKECKKEAVSEAFVPGMQASQLKARVRGIYSGCKIRSKRKGNYVPFFDSMTDSQNAYQAAKTSNQYTSLYTAGIPAKFFADYDPQVHTCLKSPLETINREINFSSIVRSFGTERAHIKLLPTQMTEQSTTLTETISLPLSELTAQATEQFEQPFFFASGGTNVLEITKSVRGLNDWLEGERLAGKSFKGEMNLHMRHDLYRKTYKATVPFQIEFGGCRRQIDKKQKSPNAAKSLWIVTDFWISPSTSDVHRSVKAIEMSGTSQPVRVSFFEDYELIYDSSTVKG